MFMFTYLACAISWKPIRSSPIICILFMGKGTALSRTLTRTCRVHWQLSVSKTREMKLWLLPFLFRIILELPNRTVILLTGEKGIKVVFHAKIWVDVTNFLFRCLTCRRLFWNSQTPSIWSAVNPNSIFNWLTAVKAILYKSRVCSMRQKGLENCFIFVYSPLNSTKILPICNVLLKIPLIPTSRGKS